MARLLRRGSKEADNGEREGESEGCGITERRTSRKLRGIMVIEGRQRDVHSRVSRRGSFHGMGNGRSIELLVYRHKILAISPSIETIITIRRKRIPSANNKRIVAQ